MNVYNSKEAANKLKIKVQDLYSVAKLLKIKKISQTYFFTDQSIEKIKKALDLD